MRLRLTLLGLALVALPLSAQQPDFSGTWKLNKEKSDPMGMMGGMRGGEGGQPGAPREMPEITLMISQFPSKMVIDQKMGEQARLLTYYLDGRESTNPGMRGADLKTTSKWDGVTLVTEGWTRVNTPNGEFDIGIKEVRALSEDGRTMTVTTTTVSPRGEMTRKSVFDKQ